MAITQDSSSEMRIFFWFFMLVSIVCADYFDILRQEFEQTPTGKVRRFFITAEEEIWDYASESQNPVSGNKRDKSVQLMLNSVNRLRIDVHSLGTRYYKAIYHEYQDETYTERKVRPHWQGNMGPILRAEVGDIIQIFFWNKASRNFTIHPHGVFYEFEMEGAIFKGSFEEGIVKPNHNYTYTWNVLPRAGPGPKDGNSIVWGYHSHVTEADLFAGLYGAIVVYKPGTLSNDDIVTSVFVADENQSPYFDRTLSTLDTDIETLRQNVTEFYAANQFPSINGLISSSPKDLIIKPGTTWHLIGWGTYWDMQKMYWQDSQVKLNGESVDHVRIMPASFHSLVVTPNNHANQSHIFGTFESYDQEMSMSFTNA
ncbi:Hephaestin-like protein 1 [Choanephora cucurbitarum]|uniref:Hephaestin-like protein 1 n=1 Tax=Choanephora cucurbitarum TaxID=101091 RepID=A0A1C7NCQ0_9FUNG|nr:Hephaestin-like protein 1 [Choanephora cucurbitarum]